MTARLKSGFFCFWAPTGYRYVKGDAGGKVLERDEPTASLLQEALEGFASGRFDTQAAVARFLEPHAIFARDVKGAIHPQRIRNLLTNTLYAGYYEYKPWGVGLTKGNHAPIISWETFQRIQERLADTTTAPQKTSAHDDFPLRGHIACGACGHPMTGYWAKGRNKRYAYYECFQKGCDARRKSI
ncbi:MAG: recombinase family protein [Pseudomonadota bacterium]